MHDLYKGFRKIAEDDRSATLEHEQGHQLNIAKHGLSKKQKMALKRLPLFQAKGTQEPEQQMPDAGNAAKQVGINIADAVATKILQGASEATSTPVQQQLTPEQIAQMPEPTATSVETGEPIAPAVGAEPQQKIHGLGSTPMPPGPLAGFIPGGDMAPDEPGYKYAERKQKEYDEYIAQQKLIDEAEKSQQQRLGGPGIFAALQPPAPIENQPTLAETEEQKQISRPVAEIAPQAAMQPAMPKPVKQLRPLTPEETIASSRTTASQKMMAYNQLIMKSMAERRALREKFEKDIRSKQLEPKKMYGDNVFKNIATVISLMMGGMAGGILKQENPALKMINEEIERDLDKQKANINTETSLYKYNLDMMNDDIQAYTQAQNQMRQIALTQMDELLGKSYDPSNPMMALQLQAAASQLREQIDKSDAAVAERQQRENLLKSLNSSSGVSNMDPSGIAQIIIKDDGDRAKVFEEIKDRAVIADAMPEIFRLFDKAKAQNTALRTGTVPYVGGLFKKPDAVNSLEALMGKLIKTEGPARDTEVKRILKAIVPSPYDSDEDHETKRKTLKEYIRAASKTPVSNAYQLDLNKFKITNFVDPEDVEKMQFLEYAQKNINSTDPAKRERSKKILQLYGR